MSLLIQRIAESYLLKFTHLLHQLVSIPTEGTGCKVCWLSNFSPSLFQLSSLLSDDSFVLSVF